MRWFKKMSFTKRRFYDEQPATAEEAILLGSYRTISDTFLIRTALVIAARNGCDVCKIRLSNTDYVSYITLYCNREEYLEFIQDFLNEAGEYLEGVEI